MSIISPDSSPPTLLPLGDSALLVRFAPALSDTANRRVIAFAQRLARQLPPGVVEIDPNLVSVLVRFDPFVTDFARLAGELRLLLSLDDDTFSAEEAAEHRLTVRFGGAEGPDLASVAQTLGLDEESFVAKHNRSRLRVLTTGFAPGFVYCGFHPPDFVVPRRQTVRARVEAGTVLFAAGQTAIAATPIPTGWHVIGRTDFRNFDPQANPPTQLREGDHIVMVAA